MPIISRIGRKHWKVRVQYAIIYVLLCLGAVTMIYPFLTMISGSLKSAVDSGELGVIPDYLHDDAVLYHKHLEGLFNESLDAMNMAYNATARSFDSMALPSEPNAKLVAEWQSFIENSDLPDYTYTIGYVRANVSRALPHHLRGFKQYCAERFGRDIPSVNRALESEFVTWNAFYIIPEEYLPRRGVVLDTPYARTFRDYKAQQPLADRHYFSVEGFYRKLFLMSQYTRDIDEYNASHGTSYESYEDIHLPRRCPEGSEAERHDWEVFVRNSLNLLWIRMNRTAAAPYRDFLKAKYSDLATLNRSYASSYRAFHAVPVPESAPAGGIPRSDWEAFLQGWRDPDSGTLHMAPVETLRIDSVDFMFRDFLLANYGSLEEVNRQLNTSYAAEADILMPQQEAQYSAFRHNAAGIRREFMARNYITVFEYLVRHGRGILNTAIYCFLAVLAALIVNPLAAYAMSRYRMASSYKILLFLMLTMAFPPMVTQIPVFLMLREMKLLNTFAALVLPGLANGYSIFLLKGFFDSLPRELYESAQLDGASEWTMFWRITMSLSKPILSVVALQAFTIAYSNFMFALLICQDQKMWTLMVWLYQLQQRSGQAVIYASLIIAAIPTFIIFVFCQKIIMRGIVVPVEQ